MSEYHRLTDQKYSEDYLFQTIEMAKSDEEFNLELSSPPPSNEVEVPFTQREFEPNIFVRKLVKSRRPRRRYTVSHGGASACGAPTYVNGQIFTALCANGGCNNNVPPAPPSTPTSLTPTNTSLSSSQTTAGIADCLDRLLYIEVQKNMYKRKLTEEQRDAELAELFNVVSITASTSTSSSSKTKIEPERGVSSASRPIRKNDVKILKVFKRHDFSKDKNGKHKECYRERDEEDSVSAPEYDTEEEKPRFRRLDRNKYSQRMSLTKRQRRFARFEHAERMEAMVDIFDEAMNFNET